MASLQWPIPTLNLGCSWTIILTCYYFYSLVYVHQLIHSFQEFMEHPSRNLLRSTTSPSMLIQIRLKPLVERVDFISGQQTLIHRKPIPSGRQLRMCDTASLRYWQRVR